jgi:hypothetical protein
MAGSNSLSLGDVLRRSTRRHKPLSLVEAVQTSHASGHQEHITVETVFTEHGGPLPHIAPAHPNAKIVRNGNVDVLWLTADEGVWFIAAWPAGRAGVYHLVTTAHPTARHYKAAMRSVRRARGVIQTFLNHDDFESIGTGLTEFGDVEVGRVTARSAVDGSSDSRGWKATPQGRPNHTDVIRMMDMQDYSVRTLTIHIESVISFHLRRTAGATYYSGDFNLFSERVLSALMRAAHERRSLLVGRARRPSAGVRPVSISLPTPLLDRADASTEVLTEVAKLSRTTLAVFHRNPYLHFALTDEADGSNFDVMVTQPDAIDVYPGFRASPGAIARLVDYISDRFGGDRVANRESRTYSLAELSLG